MTMKAFGDFDIGGNEKEESVGEGESKMAK